MRHLFIAQRYLRFYEAAQFRHWAAFHMQEKQGNNKKRPRFPAGETQFLKHCKIELVQRIQKSALFVGNSLFGSGQQTGNILNIAGDNQLGCFAVGHFLQSFEAL